MAKKEKTKIIGIVALTLGLVALLVITINFTFLQGIFLDQDTVYVATEDRDSTAIILNEQIHPFETFYLDVNLIAGTDSRVYGTYPSLSCVSTWGSAYKCCQLEGWSSFHSASGINKCYRDVTTNPEYVKMYVGGELVYDWNGQGSYPTQSINFADTVNEICDLSFDIAPTSENINGRTCTVPITFDTGNKKGTINVGISYAGEQREEVTTIPTPIIEDPEPIVCEEGLILMESECVAPDAGSELIPSIIDGSQKVSQASQDLEGIETELGSIIKSLEATSEVNQNSIDRIDFLIAETQSIVTSLQGTVDGLKGIQSSIASSNANQSTKDELASIITDLESNIARGQQVITDLGTVQQNLQQGNDSLDQNIEDLRDVKQEISDVRTDLDDFGGRDKSISTNKSVLTGIGVLVGVVVVIATIIGYKKMKRK